MPTRSFHHSPALSPSLLLALLLAVLCLTAHPIPSSAESTSKGKKPSISAKPAPKKATSKSRVQLTDKVTMYTGSKYRGWDYLVNRLRSDGMSEAELASLFQDKRMPWFTEIPFAVKPRESHRIYQGFKSRSKLEEATRFIERHRLAFEEAERTLRVSRYAIAALLLIETHFGQNTGRELVIHRLARLASVGDGENVERNLRRLQKLGEDVTLSSVVARARYLEEMFYPEVRALLQIAREQNLDLFAFKGSSAGAFGMPQFLPSSYLKFGVDADNDGHVDLFSEPDAIWSTANFLASFGWRDDATDEEKMRVFWKYNHSEAYVATALDVKSRLKLMLEPEPPRLREPALRRGR